MRRYFSSLGARLLDRVWPFWRNECAAVAIYVGITSVLMIGFGALVIDLGRLMTVNTELQNAADAAALAGAAELNGNTDSITRATKAAEGALVTNKEDLYTTGGSSTVGVANIRFLSSLPSSDSDPITSSYVTADPTQARFIEVTVDTRRVDYLLAGVLKVALGGGNGVTSGDTDAVAVAGNNSVVCKVPPLMICNPDEDPAAGIETYTAKPGEQILLKMLGANTQWTPGGFGLLVPPDGSSGANAVANYLASGDANGCFSTEVNIDTGQKEVKVQNAINVRFDMYSGFSSSNSAYRPASNVIKGKYYSGGKWVDYTGTPLEGTPLPIDSTCFAGGTRICYDPMSTSPGSPTYAGNSDELGTYWQINHGATLDQTTIDAMDANGDGIVTLKEVYNYENANGIPNNAGSSTTDPSTASGENGNPTNYTGTTAADPARRVVQLAVINCLANNINGASGGPYPVLEFLDMFLMRPAEDPSTGGVYAEVMRTLVPGQDDELHDIVQLYR